jgi:hypothetical protein
MPKVGRFVTDPRAGAYCQITLDSGEKVIVNHVLVWIAAKVAGEAMERLGQTAVLGELLAGCSSAPAFSASSTSRRRSTPWPSSAS